MSALTEQVYKAFKQAVFDGRLRVGVNYTQKELSTLLETSIYPIREALKLLQHEGFVTIKAHSYVHIRKPDLTVFRECHQLRRIFEISGISHFAISAKTEEFEFIRTLQLDLHRRASDGEDLSSLTNLQYRIELLLPKSAKSFVLQGGDG